MRLIHGLLLIASTFALEAQESTYRGLTNAGFPIELTVEDGVGVAAWEYELRCGVQTVTISEMVNPPCEIDAGGDFSCGEIRDCFIGSSFVVDGNLMSDTIAGAIEASIRIPFSNPPECCEVTVRYNAILVDDDLLFSDSFES